MERFAPQRMTQAVLYVRVVVGGWLLGHSGLVARKHSFPTLDRRENSTRPLEMVVLSHDDSLECWVKASTEISASRETASFRGSVFVP